MVYILAIVIVLGLTVLGIVDRICEYKEKQIDKKINTKYCSICGAELTEENAALPNMCNACKYGEE